MASDDSEYEEEETHIVVELSGIMETDYLSKAKDCKILGIDTDRPVLQLDHYIFAGEYQDTLGTCMLFEEKSKTGDVNTGESSTQENREKATKDLEFKLLCTKKLCMQRAFLKSRQEKKETENKQSETAGDVEPAKRDENDVEVSIQTEDVVPDCEKRQQLHDSNG
ncbi:hypothetical protein CHS0354_008997 [Potamilus streckersoni]|uniref:Transcription factor TFIIIC triple barrel domain-containing protein n=1 Tax=Potamilus streckersoni TaxID=2493646 RepID=A0AAE0WDD5_9BIVA|nr:hypothetical protein CHS0354_008997 [Potamilus streckersoni]